jgi:hypothetical protein
MIVDIKLQQIFLRQDRSGKMRHGKQEPGIQR